jgi:hypothetical protein
MNRPAEARLEYRNVPAGDLGVLTGEAILAARSRNLVEVERSVAIMRQLFGELVRYQFAQIYAQARDADRAFAELNRAFEVRDPGLIGLKVDPFLDPIRGDPRMDELARKLNFP